MRTLCCWIWMAAAMAGADPGIAGKWRSVETSRGGLGALYEFSPDGNMKYATGAIVAGKYQLDDKKLTISISDKFVDKAGGPKSFSVELLNATTLKYTDGKESTEFQRVGNPEIPKLWIVGTWKQPMPGVDQVDRIVRFDANGGYLLTVPVRQRSGYYKVLPGGQIWLNYLGASQVEGAMKLDGDTLTIPSGSGKPAQFVRYR